jgi:alkylated DNA repair dioxygenase AlkB
MYDRIVDVPRLLAWFEADEPWPDPELGTIRDRLNARYADGSDEPFVTLGLCLYRNGRDSVAWHGDTIGAGRPVDTLVAIVSLGATRRLALRPRGGGAARSFPLAHGDLLVMGGSCQYTWEHAVPKTSRLVGPRVSAQLRARGVR